MLRELQNKGTKALDFSIPKGTTVTSIVRFLDAKLPVFAKQFNKGLTNEDEITQECCIYLNREARRKNFMFHFQYKYVGSRRSSDMSVISAEAYASTEPLFVIEAKRLPTPGSGRQREYVQGNLGGIERFKREHHGDKLISSAIVGYVQEDSVGYWHIQVSDWIKELITTNTDSSITWDDSDHLILVSAKGQMTKYKSVGQRTSGNTIALLHYWIDLTS